VDDGLIQYLPNQYYRVYVTVPEGNAIELSFENFDVEEDGIENECENDVAIVFNGPDGNYELGRYCGINEPPVIFGTRQDMTLVFKTNENDVNHNGFKATFTMKVLDEPTLAWNNILNTFDELKATIFAGHDHIRTHLQNKKALFFNRIFSQFVWMGDYGALECDRPADVGTGVDFTPPTSDFSDPCFALGDFIDSIRSFHYAYVCMDNLYPQIYTPTPGETKEERRDRMKKIPSKAKRMLYKQKVAFTDQKFHAMGCLLE